MLLELQTKIIKKIVQIEQNSDKILLSKPKQCLSIVRIIILVVIKRKDIIVKHNRHMKKLLVFFVVVAGMVTANGQEVGNILLEAKSAKFFGVDFSEARVYGAKETVPELLQAFEDINKLFLEQPEKYDFGKFLNKEVSEVSIDAVISVIDDIDEEELKTEDSSYRLDDKTINEMIKFLPVDGKEGLGVVMIAEMLNRSAKIGSYMFVYFSLENKEILGSFRAEGRATGANLKYFWSSSIYEIIRNHKPTLKEWLFSL